MAATYTLQLHIRHYLISGFLTLFCRWNKGGMGDGGGLRGGSDLTPHDMRRARHVRTTSKRWLAGGEISHNFNLIPLHPSRKPTTESSWLPQLPFVVITNTTIMILILGVILIEKIICHQHYRRPSPPKSSLINQSIDYSFQKPLDYDFLGIYTG